MKRFLFLFVVINLGFAGQQTLLSCKVISVQLFGDNYAADAQHKAGQMQVQIDPQA